MEKTNETTVKISYYKGGVKICVSDAGVIAEYKLPLEELLVTNYADVMLKTAIKCLIGDKNFTQRKSMIYIKNNALLQKRGLSISVVKLMKF